MAEEKKALSFGDESNLGTFDFRGSASRHCRGASKAGLSHPADYSRFLKLRNPCRNYPGPEPENFPYFAPFFPGSAPDSCYNGIIESANSKLTSVSPVDKDSALFFRRRVPVCIRNPAPASGILRDALLVAFRSSTPVSAIFFLFP